MNLKPITVSVLPNKGSVCIGFLEGIDTVIIGAAFGPPSLFLSKSRRILDLSASPLAQKSSILADCTPHFVETEFFDNLKETPNSGITSCLQKYRLSDDEILDGNTTNLNLVWHDARTNALYTSDLTSELTLVLNLIA